MQLRAFFLFKLLLCSFCPSSIKMSSAASKTLSKDVPKELRHFKDIKQIGEGVYGVVFKAIDKRHNTTYALKRIKLNQ